MCIMKTPKPQVEQVAPAPTNVSETDTNAMADRAKAEAEKQRKRKGYASTRIADDRAVLTDTASGGARQTLG